MTNSDEDFVANEALETVSKQDQYLSAVRHELDLFERRERDFRAQLRRQRAEQLTEGLSLQLSDLR
ncbi:hypothetical protein [Rhodopseudomonas palustris]|nr:hypothetical protein [Rhodopseudomonas palustris]